LDLLEKIAIDEFDAKWLTLDTRVYGPPDGPDDHSVEGTTLAWYRRRGYEEFLVSSGRDEAGWRVVMETDEVM